MKRYVKKNNNNLLNNINNNSKKTLLSSQKLLSSDDINTDVGHNVKKQWRRISCYPLITEQVFFFSVYHTILTQFIDFSLDGYVTLKSRKLNSEKIFLGLIKNRNPKNREFFFQGKQI